LRVQARFSAAKIPFPRTETITDRDLFESLVARHNLPHLNLGQISRLARWLCQCIGSNTRLRYCGLRIAPLRPVKATELLSAELSNSTGIEDKIKGLAERNPSAIGLDLLDGYVSASAATRDYGIVGCECLSGRIQGRSSRRRRNVSALPNSLAGVCHRCRADTGSNSAARTCSYDSPPLPTALDRRVPRPQTPKAGAGPQSRLTTNGKLREYEGSGRSRLKTCPSRFS
jgi:hypothetical protein